jgi:membrane protease YdiL (CAAX protease family)
MMTIQNGAARLWSKLPLLFRALVSGLLIAMVAANVWPLLLLNLRVPFAAAVEVAFLGFYLWWAAGGGLPRTTKAARMNAFRRGALSPRQWLWGILAALLFALTVHASIYLLFRVVPFPVSAFRQGYDLSFIPTLPLKWLAVVISALSAGVCEETGFRGYTQRPIEQRFGAPAAILISSLFFTAVHLSKAWALVGMIPIVFGAGVLLGLLAWASKSLLPGIVGHVVMDVGLLAYWWCGIAGDFTQRPITQTGLDQPFFIACAVFAASLLVLLLAIARLRRISAEPVS